MSFVVSICPYVSALLPLDTLPLNLVLESPVVCGEVRSVSIFLFRCKNYSSNEALHYGHKISERATGHIIRTLIILAGNSA